MKVFKSRRLIDNLHYILKFYGIVVGSVFLAGLFFDVTGIRSYIKVGGGTLGMLSRPFEQVSVQVRLQTPADTTFYLKSADKKESKTFPMGGGFWMGDEPESFKRERIEALKYLATYPFRDTVLHQFLVRPAINHPSMEGKVTFSESGDTRSYSISGLDEFLSKPIFTTHRIENVQGKMQIKPAFFWDRFWLRIPVFFKLLLHLLVVWQLVRLLGMLKKSVIFGSAHVRCIQWMGGLICATYFLPYANNFIYASLIDDISSTLSVLPVREACRQYTHISAKPYDDTNIQTLFLGLLVLVLSTVFRHGFELQQDQDLTV